MIAALAMAADSGDKKDKARGEGRPETAAQATAVVSLVTEEAAAPVDPIDLMTPLPEGTVAKHLAFRASETGAVERYVEDGSVAAANVLVYSNLLGHTVLGTSVANSRIADDISMTGLDGSFLDKYMVRVSGDRAGNGTDLLTPYTVTLALYKSCPGASANPSLQVISGTQLVVPLPDGGVYDVQVAIPFLVQVPLPNSFFVGVSFNRTNTGVVVGAPPTLGVSADRFDFPGFPCGGALGGFPDGPHASFVSEVYVRSSSKRVFAGYRASRQSGPAFTRGPKDAVDACKNRFADDILMDVPNCKMVAYEVSVKGKTSTGSGAIEFDLRDQLDGSNPGSGGRIAGTRKQVFVFGSEVVVSHHNFDPPITLPESLFLSVITSSDVVGAIVAGRQPTIGTTGNGYVFCENDEWVVGEFPGQFGSLDVTIYCEGTPTIGACCDMIYPDEQGEAVCRELPRRNCATAINNSFSALWVGNRECLDQCVGGTRNGLDCTRQADCPGGECPGPFPLAPCGLAACCTFSDECFTSTQNQCNAIEPVTDPRLFQRGEICGLPGQRCPRGPCLGREGACGDGREAFCLIGPTAGDVCDPFLPTECSGQCFDPDPNAPVIACSQNGQCASNICARQACDRGDRDGLACSIDAHCPGGTCSRPNCEGQPGCEDPFCCTEVCARDAFCCETHWDIQCAELAATIEECRKGPVNDDCANDRAGLGAKLVQVPDIVTADVGGGTTRSYEPGFCCHNGLRQCSGGTNPGRHCASNDDCFGGGSCVVTDSTLGPGSSGVGTLWYKFVAPPASPGATFSSVSIRTCDNADSNLDSLLQVFSVPEPDRGICTDLSQCSVAGQDCLDGSPCVFDEAAACAGLIPIACSDDDGTCATSTGSARPFQSRLCASGLVPGQVYYFMIAAKSEDSVGPYRITLSANCLADLPMENDFCDSAIVLEGLDAYVEFDLSGTAGGTLPASFDCPGPVCSQASNTLFNDIWYDWVAPATGSATIDTCGEAPSGQPCDVDPFGCDGTTPDTTMAVYEGCDCPVSPFGELACSNFKPTPCFGGSGVEIPVTKDTCYKIRMGGHRGGTPAGNLEVHFSGCPVGDVEFQDPDGVVLGSSVVDARQPHSPSSAATRQGIRSIRVAGPAGLDNPSCWALCEEVIDVAPNEIQGVSNNGDGTYSVNFKRTISVGAVSTLTFTAGDNVQTSISLASHPGNSNGDGMADAADISSLIDYVTGVGVAPYGRYSTDIDHSGAMAPGDILRLIDVLNGGDALNPWIDSSLPECSICCIP